MLDLAPERAPESAPESARERTPGGCCGTASAALAAAGTPAARLEIGVEGMRCAGCMATVERAAAALPGVLSARVSLSQRRRGVAVAADGPSEDALIAAVEAAGFAARPLDRVALEALDRDEEGRALLLRLGVAGFAAMNVMLLSVAI
ncbi:MAG: cation transporter, partial [Pseudomonadota bacterium]